jgi:hypothetical protein
MKVDYSSEILLGNILFNRLTIVLKAMLYNTLQYPLQTLVVELGLCY